MAADCVFCKIRDGELPSMRVYEDDRTLAIMDINPL
ncbi:MAG TPA: histidine triad nucleotide-binding protein, partial [Candidatus Limnocylindria bacterium]|nr:histidine triad nucleotide-binding protein [Candidatus Limnocylindria bacterium]